jgi:hypothetical protein
LKPDKFIADLGSGSSLGLSLAYKENPSHADVFHILFYLKKLSLYFKNLEKISNALLQKLLTELEKSTNPEKVESLVRQIEVSTDDAAKFKHLVSFISILAG